MGKCTKIMKKFFIFSLATIVCLMLLSSCEDVVIIKTDVEILRAIRDANPQSVELAVLFDDNKDPYTQWYDRSIGIIGKGARFTAGRCTHLNLCNTQLTTFNGAGLSALTYLNLGNVPTFVVTGLTLIPLHLYDNQLTTFNSTGLTALQELSLRHNQFTTFDGTGLTSLTRLDLEANQLTTFNGTGLTSLTYLELQNNKLTTFNGTGLTELTSLNLSGNKLTTTQIETLLALLVSYQKRIGWLNIPSGTNAPYPTWSAQAKADRATLTSRGWTVNNNW